MNGPLKVFAGSSHRSLAHSICNFLDIKLGHSETIKFSNENLMVKIMENVRECDVFVIQTAAPPVNENIMELLIMLDALKHASAKRITAVLPYFPYARSDKKDRPRISITARLMADLLQTAGANRALTMNLHSPQIQGFFRIPVDQLIAAPLICEYYERRDLSNYVIVAGDAGEAKDVVYYANRLNLPLAIIDKRRYDDTERPIATNVIGEVEGKNALLVDDEISTAGTMIEATRFLLDTAKAASVEAAAVHPVLSGDAVKRLNASRIKELIVTDSIPLRGKEIASLKTISVAQLFARAIQRIHNGDSVSDLFG